MRTEKRRRWREFKKHGAGESLETVEGDKLESDIQMEAIRQRRKWLLGKTGESQTI